MQPRWRLSRSGELVDVLARLVHGTGTRGVHRALVHRRAQITEHPVLGVPLRPLLPGHVGHRSGADPRLWRSSWRCGPESRRARGVQRGELTPEPLGGGTVRSAGGYLFGDQPVFVVSVHPR